MSNIDIKSNLILSSVRKRKLKPIISYNKLKINMTIH